ncbi:RnfH family protein [Hydrogenophaga sp.]|uniref:RnfH family protein n=1 Tax=Hydrogenophaga sp. TaxID=1904254 RepID=UPI003F6C8CED
MSNSLRISLVYAIAPRTVHETVLDIAPGTTVLQALEQSGWLVRFPEIQAQELPLGVWGSKTSTHTQLRAGDRLEVYRALRVDPKVARRERFVGQGARGTGLFNRRRPGSKAGY